MTNTTNTTKKTNGKIKRTLTAALAAIMMMSTAATIAASAADTKAVVNMNTNTAITTAENYGSYVKVDRELLTVKNVTSKTIFKVLEEFTEYGKFFTPALSSILDLFIGAKYCSEKGISIRTLLNSVGINTSAVPQNANLVTSEAIDGSNGDADRIFREVYYEKTFYMGINIDQVGATEQKYQLLDCGWNLWKGGEEWNTHRAEHSAGSDKTAINHTVFDNSKGTVANKQ